MSNKNMWERAYLTTRVFSFRVVVFTIELTKKKISSKTQKVVLAAPVQVKKSRRNVPFSLSTCKLPPRVNHQVREKRGNARRVHAPHAIHFVGVSVRR